MYNILAVESSVDKIAIIYYTNTMTVYDYYERHDT